MKWLIVIKQYRWTRDATVSIALTYQDERPLMLKSCPIRISHTTTGESNVLVSDALDSFCTTLTFGEVHTPDASLPPFDVRFVFAKGRKGDTNHHFHASATEYLYVQQGSIRVTLDGVVRMVGPQDGQIEILPWTPHRWEVLGDSDEDTIVLERTVPANGRKEAFFRNFVSLINDYKDFPPPLQVFKIFADYDNYPIGAASWMKPLRWPIIGLTHSLGSVAGWAGYKSMYTEYTPRELYARLQ